MDAGRPKACSHSRSHVEGVFLCLYFSNLHASAFQPSDLAEQPSHFRERGQFAALILLRAFDSEIPRGRGVGCLLACCSVWCVCRLEGRDRAGEVLRGVSLGSIGNGLRAGVCFSVQPFAPDLPQWKCEGQPRVCVLWGDVRGGRGVWGSRAGK